MIGFIYKLTSPHTPKIYIGSTFETLNTRYIEHKYNWKKNRSCSSKIIFAAGKGNGVAIELIEKVQVTDKTELRKLEQNYMRELNNIVNIKKAFQTKEERNEARAIYYYCDVCQKFVRGIRTHEKTSKHIIKFIKS